MLDKVEEAVAKVSEGKKLVVVDGVGYPSVGSVVGVSNAHMAKRLGAKVLLVGKHGVGDAIDSFNINAAFFEKFGVQVAAAIFNKISEPYEDTKQHVTLYFEKQRPDIALLGFIPLAPHLAGPEGESKPKKACQLATKETLAMNEKDVQMSQEFIEQFMKYVDVGGITRVF